MRSKDQWRLSDELWEMLEPLLPVHEPRAHPLGCHRRRVPDRQVLDGIFFVLRTGVPWKALDATGICSGSTAHARFQEWARQGVFGQLWEEALKDYQEARGLNWQWLSMDGCMTKAPLGGEKNRPQPDGPRQAGHQAQPAVRGRRGASGGGGGGGQPQRLQAVRGHLRGPAR